VKHRLEMLWALLRRYRRCRDPGHLRPGGAKKSLRRQKRNRGLIPSPGSEISPDPGPNNRLMRIRNRRSVGLGKPPVPLARACSFARKESSAAAERQSASRKRKNLIKEAIWSCPMPESGMDVVGPAGGCDGSAAAGPHQASDRANSPIAARATEGFTGARDCRCLGPGRVRIGYREPKCNPQGSPVKKTVSPQMSMVVEVRDEMSPRPILRVAFHFVLVLRLLTFHQRPFPLPPPPPPPPLSPPFLHTGVGLECNNCQSCVFQLASKLNERVSPSPDLRGGDEIAHLTG
jgi:hypothetical protein